MSPGQHSVTRSLALVALIALAAACGSDDSVDGPSAQAAPTPEAAGSAEAVTLRLGYFPNVTHAPAIIGVENGIFVDALDEDVELELATFNSGTEVVEAIFSGALDASFIGPNPAINGYARSNGDALRIVAGTTSGGASLVVREGIASAADLAGTRIATPSLGNTQDVALRAWLLEEGYESDTSGGGDVAITPLDNADILAAFQSGQLDGAWVPEPWATRLVLEGGGQVFLNEAELWPDGQFVTTHLIVARSFLDEHPDVIRDLIAGLADAIDVTNADTEAAQQATNDGIERLTTTALGDDTIAGAWANLTFTIDPIAPSLQKSADDAVEVDLLEPVDLTDPGIYDLALLDEVLADRGQPAVEGL